MFAYGIVSLSILALALFYFSYVGFTDNLKALLFDIPLLCAGVYMAISIVMPAPLALGIVSIILVSIEALVFLIVMLAGIYESEGDMIVAGFLCMLVCANSIVYLGCAL